MDNVPQKRPEQPDGNNHASPSPAITLPNRPRTTVDKQDLNVTSNGRRELSASHAVNARSASAAHDQDEDDDDYTSSSGSSLSSSDDEEDDDAKSESAGLDGDNEGITSLPARRKPNIRRIEQEPGLLGRLSAFLPQMKSANEDLEREIAAGRGKDIQLDDGDEDEENDSQREGQYIEMNLGLGVLEEKRPGDEEDKEAPGSHGPTGNTDLMDRLMGKEKKNSSDKPSIQDLGE
ncbi:NOPCHAP1/New4 family protein [Aspergillus mulundensis]|uniref:Uncharacterized protein n=1 Tax=Aspergillus mulundensis TaxID=1810919 RepID=A0A3D8RRM5_9EURO|nr:Uncharacterized protein DSM5745_06612 [Aspergillus mulundensis]RDW76620.1 Uncharacterized protein DSM5745_06612 [Aspergillus mulundensis]